MPAELPVAEKAPSAPVHKPASVMTPTEAVQTAVVPEVVKEREEVKAPAIVSAPVVKAPAAPKVTPKAPAAPKATARVDHTPRPAARVRITSTERNELMEEYMRVMSDEDDEPSYKKPMFSFFKKKKKYDDEDDFDTAEDLYEDIDDTDEDSLEDEIPVVPFDNSQVQYEDEYSSSPEDGFITDDEIPQAPMNLYDYIEADFDYDAEEEAEEEIAEEIIEEAAEEPMTEEVTDEPSETIEEAADTADEETEEIVYPEEVSEAIEELPEEEAIEEIIPAEEEPQEPVYEEAPTAGMVFEDIFSVSDESKRSHTGGNWNEVFGEEAAEEEIVYEPEAVIYPEEEAAEEVAEAIEEPAYEEEAIEEIIPTEEASEEAEETQEETYDDYAEEAEEDLVEEDEAEPVKSKLAVKIIMSLAVVLCLAIAGISIFASAVLGVDTGKIFSDRYRAFSVPETITELGISKGDLVITENIYASADQLYVYTEQSAYKIGKVTATTTNLLGDYLYITQTSDGIKLINRDTSLGVVTDTYSDIGSVLSAISEYGIYIAIASIVFAIALIICLAIIITKQRRYEAAAAIYDNPDNFRDDEDDNTPDSDNDNNGEYYSDYDTDGIEQGLFAEL